MVNYTRFISARANKFQPSGIRGLFPLENRPGMISFLAGKPNPTTFPFSELSVTIKSAPPVTLTLSENELNEALQYGPTAGLPGLVKWLIGLQEQEHGRSWEGEGRSWKVSIGSGSQDSMTKVFNTIVNPGEPVLIETPVYSGTLGALTQTDYVPISIPTDGEGLISSTLEETLSTWSTTRPDLPFPKVIYTCPTGSNPTGCSSTLQRKKEVMALVEKYDLLLVEDDAYWFVFYGTDEKPKSYFELEGQGSGRVIRLDSFSKILSSGMRLGFVTGPSPIIDKIDLDTANSNLQTASTTQAIALKLLNHWGVQGLREHCKGVSAFYEKQRDMFEDAARRHLQGLATWVTPIAGMFLFLRLQLDEDPSVVADTYHAISSTAIEKGILGVPGTSFMPGGGKSPYVRVSFSLATSEQAEEGFKRLREVILQVREERKAVKSQSTS
ncbi:PLP-dependent transferase [Atractiella rhizophila]|nr:PLP-dependent transferase [Atractiella rhizophila]